MSPFAVGGLDVVFRAAVEVIRARRRAAVAERRAGAALDALARIGGAGPRRGAAAVVAEWLSISETAAVTGLSVTTIRRAVVRHDLPAANAGTPKRPTWRIARKNLDEWMERKKSETAVAVPPGSELSDLIDRHLPGLRGRRA